MRGGKLIEDLQYVQAVPPALRNTVATLYNGEALSVSNNGIDTRPCDEINFVVNAGEFVGVPVLDLVIVQSNTNNPATATLITGRTTLDVAGTAAFTTITAATDSQLHNGSLKAKNFNRYMWVRSHQAAATTYYGVIAVKGKCDRDPQSNSPVFDLNY